MKAEETKKALKLLFDRPQEPLFHSRRGDDGIVFDTPTSFIARRFQTCSGVIVSRMKRSESPKLKIEVNEHLKLPDIHEFADKLPRDKSFSLWIPKHAKIASKLIRLFMDQTSIDDLLAVAAYLRDEINTELFNYSLSVALLHRKDTRGIEIPSLIETFPYKFLDPSILRKARESLSILPREFRAPITADSKNSNMSRDANDEQKLWYFREDVGVKHWHLVNPHTGILELVAKDRRGELFYYMHQQMMARYNSERISNGMKKVVVFSDFGETLRDGFYPKLGTIVANRTWPARPDNTKLESVIRDDEDVRIDIDEMRTYLSRFREVVKNGRVVSTQDEEFPLDEFYGIDILGNLMESSVISPNQDFYGNLHNYMHLLVSYSHDPKNVELADIGAIGDPTTAMRDPIFYRIHAFVDELFQEFKAKLQPYSISELSFADINVVSIETQTTAVKSSDVVKNKLFTFWQQSDVNLSRGLDFSPRGDVFARLTHLQHGAFTLKVTVNNEGGLRVGTVRVFMSPKYGFDGEPLNFNQQRLLMIEIDRFTAQIHPGTNVIVRRSTESAVTIPHEQTFRNLDANRPALNSEAEHEFFICGCGWPQHMLIPKGSKASTSFELFVMITDETLDSVEQDAAPGKCLKSVSYCGVRDRAYPDRRAMGFPFDRVRASDDENLKSFLTHNMATQDIEIHFHDKLVNKRRQ